MSKIKRDRGDGIMLSDEQVELIRQINIEKNNVAVLASAGAAKSSSVYFALTDPTCNFKNVLSIVYNNKAAKETREYMPDFVEVKTVHALAYKYIVAPLRLKVKSYTQYNDFKKASYLNRSEASKVLKEYCKSDVIKISDFTDNKTVQNLIKDLMVRSLNGELPITFDIYLKWFQIQLVHGDIVPDEVELLAGDEYHDFSPVMHSIFENYPAKQRLAVGDNNQRINRFMGSSDALSRFADRDDVTICTLSSTMRCTPEMAGYAERFCKLNLDKRFFYTGSNMSEPKYEDLAYLTRTNASLIAVAAMCMRDNIKFNTSRSVSVIFNEFLWILSRAKKEFKYYTENARHSQGFNRDNMRYVSEYKKYISDLNVAKLFKSGDIEFKEALHRLSDSVDSKVLRKKNVTFISWIMMNDELTFEHESMIRSAAVLSRLIDADIDIYRVYDYAKKLEDSKEKFNFTLSTAHSSKGMTYDAVWLDDDLSTALLKEFGANSKKIDFAKKVYSGEEIADDDSLLALVDKAKSEDFFDDLEPGVDSLLYSDITNLYYVAFTRARYRAYNAKAIKYYWKEIGKCDDDKIDYPWKDFTIDDFMKLVKNNQKNPLDNL